MRLMDVRQGWMHANTPLVDICGTLDSKFCPSKRHASFLQLIIAALESPVPGLWRLGFAVLAGYAVHHALHHPHRNRTTSS